MQLSYEEVCKRWARADHWPLEDAIRLLLMQLPRSLQLDVQEDKQLDQMLLKELATNCLGSSLEASDIDLGDGPRISPYALMDWADQKSVSIPEQLRDAIDQVRLLEKKSKSYQRFSQTHKERCKGIAALLWREEPNVTIDAMKNRPEFIELGCKGRHYTAQTIRGWIKSESPNHQPGRPKKEKTSV